MLVFNSLKLEFLHWYSNYKKESKWFLHWTDYFSHIKFFFYKYYTCSFTMLSIGRLIIPFKRNKLCYLYIFLFLNCSSQHYVQSINTDPPRSSILFGFLFILLVHELRLASRAWTSLMIKRTLLFVSILIQYDYF